MISKKQRRAIIELILGIGLGVPSIIDIFNGIFIDYFKAGNVWAIIGIITATFVGIIFTLDAVAIAFGLKNLGDLLEKIGYCEDEE